MEFISAGVHLVEIDPTRQKRFAVAIPEVLVPKHCRTPYILCARRAIRQSEAGLIRVPLQESLPKIAIPLRPNEKDVAVQLQPLLDECFRRGRYSSIDYTRVLDPPLGTDDRNWSQKLLKNQRTY